jgi:hypothetical protein
VSAKFVPKLQLHHDNAPAHSLLVIQGFLAKHKIPLINQAPYSPNMAPWNFWLLPKLKMPLKGTRFESREYATSQLDMIRQEIPEIFPAMAGPLEEVCALPVRLL